MTSCENKHIQISTQSGPHTNKLRLVFVVSSVNFMISRSTLFFSL